MKEALDSHGGVAGCQVAVCKLDTSKQDASNTKLEGISHYNNFEYRDGYICMRKAYNIGKGKVYKVAEIADKLQGPTGLVVLDDFTPNNRVGTISSVPGSRGKTTLFPWTESGCYQSFATLQELEVHMDVGTHTKDLEQETTYDRTRKRWLEKVTGVHEQQPHNLPAEMVESITEDPQTSGWALKMAKKASTMSAAVKAFLVDQFNIGVNTGRKVDPDAVAKHMKTARKNGKFVFQPSEWRTPKQISSFFSRMAAAQKQKPVGQTLAADDESKIHADEEDVTAWEVASHEETVRQAVYDEIDISHPIRYGDVNVCLMVAHGKWKTKKIAELSDICGNFGLDIDGSGKRKDSYGKALKLLVSKCSCK